MLNRFIISSLVLALIAVPAAASAAPAMEVNSQMIFIETMIVGSEIVGSEIVGSEVVGSKMVESRIVDLDMVNRVNLVVITDGDECHKVEESDCCKTECGCCVAHFFPMSSNVTEPLSFAPIKGLLHIDDLADPTADRLIRPPITV